MKKTLASIFLLVCFALGLSAQTQPGYALPALTPNPNVPYWFGGLRESTQAIADRQYLHGSGNSLDHYYSAVDSWLTENMRLRAASADPEHYTPTPVPVIPKREIYDWQSETQTPYSRFEADPAIKAPVLPAYVKPVELPTGIHTTLPQAQADEAAKYALLVKMLSDITAKLVAIDQKLPTATGTMANKPLGGITLTAPAGR